MQKNSEMKHYNIVTGYLLCSCYPTAVNILLYCGIRGFVLMDRSSLSLPFRVLVYICHRMTEYLYSNWDRTHVMADHDE